MDIEIQLSKLLMILFLILNSPLSKFIWPVVAMI
jgi:hypothetical protein